MNNLMPIKRSATFLRLFFSLFFVWTSSIPMAEPNNAVVTRPPSLVALPMSHEEEEEEVLVGSEFVDNATAEVSRDGTNDEEDEDDDDDEDSDDDEKIGQDQYYYSSSSFDLLTQRRVSIESPFVLSFAPSLRGRPSSSTVASSSSSFVNNINNDERLFRVNDSLQQWNALVERQELDAYAVVVDDHLHPFAVPDDLRHSLCDWCYQLVDKWDVNRDAVGTAMSFFDRLLGQVEQSQLYLAVVGSLFVAVKINALKQRAFDPIHMARETNGIFNSDQIQDMEHHIFQVFDWKLNPPIPSNFVDLMTPVLLSDMLWSDGNTFHVDHATRQRVCQQAKYLCELSTMYKFYVDKFPSSIAYASIWVAISMGNFYHNALQRFKSLRLVHDIDEMALCVDHMNWIFGWGDHPLTTTTTTTSSSDYQSEESADIVSTDTDKKSVGWKEPVVTRVRAVTPTKDDLLPTIVDATNISQPNVVVKHLRTEDLLDDKEERPKKKIRC